MYLNREIARAVLIILAGVVSGGVSFFLGIAMSGMGHGWTSAASVAIVGALTAPAAAVAWLVRNRWHGRVLAGAIVVVNVFMDAMKTFTTTMAPARTRPCHRLRTNHATAAAGAVRAPTIATEAAEVQPCPI